MRSRLLIVGFIASVTGSYSESPYLYLYPEVERNSVLKTAKFLGGKCHSMPRVNGLCCSTKRMYSILETKQCASTKAQKQSHLIVSHHTSFNTLLRGENNAGSQIQSFNFCGKLEYSRKVMLSSFFLSSQKLF